MTRKGYQHLVASLREAHQMAQAALDDEPPTVNKLIVRLSRGVRLRTVQEAAVEAGLTAARAYAGGFFLHMPVTDFQLELAREILFSKGIDSDIRKP